MNHLTLQMQYKNGGNNEVTASFYRKGLLGTYVLKNLSESNYSKDVVFKGGTSLSKAYNCIERFSEDIGLELLNKEDLSAVCKCNKE
jgi:predicted nucleotidyltransferase component of viral defense system